jgi:GntR family transcriptional regulator
LNGDSVPERGPEPAGGAAGGATYQPDQLALDRRLPLWYQVSQSLRASILGRHPGSPLRLPTEDALSRHYGVSVLTVRQALRPLEEEGLITRHRRRGTFIDPAARPNAPIRLLGSVDAIVAQQSSDQVKVLSRETAPVPEEIAEHFPGLTHATRFERLRYDQGEPTSWAENHVLPELGDLVETGDLERWPMTRILRDRLGVRISRITDTVQARLADPRTAGLLGVPLLSPILHCTGVTYDQADRVVDVASIHYRGDRFSFSVTLEAGS